MTAARVFLRNAWYVAAFGEELADKPLARTILGEPLVLFRDRAGRAAVLEDRCCHRAAPLSQGELATGGLRCGYHGMVFDADGVCVHIPGQERIPPQARVRSYPLAERDGHVWIWMGDPALASEDDVQRFPHMTGGERWPMSHAMLHVKGNYVLLMENLMDLTHLAYLHRSSIGGDAHETANPIMETARTPTGVKYMRWMLNVQPPPRYVKRYGFKTRIDRWEEFEFVAPAIILQHSGALPAGTGAYDQGKRDGGHRGVVIHLLTPETERSTHYFWSIADASTPAPIDAHTTPEEKAVRGVSRAEQIKAVFREDAAMIEQQQLRLDGYDQSKLIDIRHDVARAQMTHFLQQKIAEEQTRAAAE